jgi:hypothetical protein
MTTTRVAVVLFAGLVGGSAPLLAQSQNMNFFVTSRGPGKGADLGGLAGADDICAGLGYSAGRGDLTWRAYLSTVATDNSPAVNARDRIGEGPWYNFHGVLVASDLEELHSENNNLDQSTALTERGQVVNGRADSPIHHDILTGSQPDGRAYPPGEDTTCQNWTSHAGTGSARVGHHDRDGGGEAPTSWNSAHGSRGCGQQELQATGGNGLFYCFGLP